MIFLSQGNKGRLARLNLKVLVDKIGLARSYWHGGDGKIGLERIGKLGQRGQSMKWGHPGHSKTAKPRNLEQTGKSRLKRGLASRARAKTSE